MDRMSDELPPEVGSAWKALDAGAAERAARVDVERVTARVLERLRHEGVEAPRFRWMAPATLRAAAAVVVLVAGAAIVRLTVWSPESVRLPVGIPAMDSLSSPQLEAVWEATGEVSSVVDSVSPAPTGVSLDDLSETQLETLLASMSGAEG
jgi:hypothetical protein